MRRTYPSAFEEEAQEALLVSIDYTGCSGTDVGTGADEKQYHQQERLEIEESRLRERKESGLRSVSGGGGGRCDTTDHDWIASAAVS